MNKRYVFEPDYVVPPGATLQETIDLLGLTQRELAERTGLNPKTINQIVKGIAPITAETALLLERVTAVPAAFWNSAEAKYRERLARMQERQQFAAQTQWLKRFSYAQMVKLQFIAPAKSNVERVDSLLRFLGIVSFEQWEQTYSALAGAARESSKFTDLGDLSAWLRAGEIKAQRCECQDYDRAKFDAALREIRELTRESAAAAWSKVEALCAEAGVAVVLVPSLPKTHIYGFTRWLTPRKALIQLSLRYKTDDMLWFTFFHEAAHILLHGKMDVFLEYRDSSDAKEEQANQWAADFLVPAADWRKFIARTEPAVCERDIVAFAWEQRIAPSIVLGRLQHKEKRVAPDHFNHLKRRLEIVWKGL